MVRRAPLIFAVPSFVSSSSSPVLAADPSLFYFSAANGMANSSHFGRAFFCFIAFLSCFSGGLSPFLLLRREWLGGLLSFLSRPLSFHRLPLLFLAADSRLFYFSAANGWAGSSHFCRAFFCFIAFLSCFSGGLSPFLLLRREWLGGPLSFWPCPLSFHRLSSPVLAADSRLFYFSAANGWAGSSHFGRALFRFSGFPLLF